MDYIGAKNKEEALQIISMGDYAYFFQIMKAYQTVL